VARVKRIVKLDREIRAVASDASALISRASHLFVEHLAELAWRASSRKRRHRSVRIDDILSGIASEPRIHDFLSDALGDDSFHAQQATSQRRRSAAKDDDDEDDEDDDDDDDGDGDGDEIHGGDGEKAQVSVAAADSKKKLKVAKKAPIPEISAGTRRIADFFAAKPSKKDAIPS
jgi:hypothetical protein